MSNGFNYAKCNYEFRLVKKNILSTQINYAYMTNDKIIICKVNSYNLNNASQ